MKLRLATCDDAPAIAALHTHSWRHTYHEALSAAYLRDVVPGDRAAIWQQRLASPKDSQRVLVADVDGAVGGFACTYLDEHAEWGSYLDNLHVDPAYRGLGYGRALLAGIAQLCARQATRRGLYLLVLQNNLSAQRFYLGLGAHNAQAAVWQAPDGSAAPAYWFRWETTTTLAQQWPLVADVELAC